MAHFSPEVQDAWDTREPKLVLTTVSPDGIPNSIYVLCVHKSAEDRVVIADNFMDKTKANILAGGKGSLLFLAPERRAYQLKGRLSYHTDGPVFDAMKNGWLDAKFAGRAAVELQIEEIWFGANSVT